jgi:3-hydroxymyristoyl/3-hydroxydecanoyl-(acyl carrier protein) dehydratase
MTAGAFRDLRVGGGEARARVDPAYARALCDGHFPDDPLLPGAYLAELMADLGGRLVRGALAEVVSCTFRARVRPDGDIAVAARLRGRDGDAVRVDAEVLVGGRGAARAVLRFRGGA